MTGLAFAHGTAADLTSPSAIPVRLLASESKAAPAAAGDTALRAAIVKSAQYYLRLAQTRTPAEMEAMIWQNDSLDGADHGESCAAFASLMLESGAQATGQQSWVTGGSTYPWPLHQWVDARVDPNPASLGITSVLQDAQAHSRWHPIGDGYTPRPGDWVLFDEHVEVVTKYADGVLYTIGGDSGSNLSVNAHQYGGPLAAAGVSGFVNNGALASAVSQSSGGTQASPPAQSAAETGDAATASAPQGAASAGQASVPGLVSPALSLGSGGQAATQRPQPQSQPGGPAAAGPAVAGTASIPGARPISGTVTSFSSAPSSAGKSAAPSSAGNSAAPSSARYSRSQPTPATEAVSDTPSQQAFINEIAPGALAAQRQYGVPAAVTIAQAIDESGWGQSLLATQDNNLFGIKGTGPAGSVLRPTEEYENGQPVAVTAPFRVYSNVAQSIADHSLLLATGSSYKQAMADRRSPDAFANDLTGVYATDPNYGPSLISIMRQYNLYRFDAGTSEPAAGTAAAQGGAAASAPSRAEAAGGAPAQSSPAQSGPAQSSPAHGAPAQSSLAQGSPAQSGLAQGSSTEGAAIPGAIAANGAAPGMAAHPAAGQATSGRGTEGKGAVQGASGQAGTAGAGSVAAPSGPGAAAEGSGSASIPGVLDAHAGTAAVAWPVSGAQEGPNSGRAVQAGPRTARVSTQRYVAQMPQIVTTGFITSAKTPLLRAEPIYRDVAASHGVRWELLAACDWMQCQAQPRVSPVYGEKLGTKNPDGTIYRSKSEALDQVAVDLLELATAVYGINLRQRLILSVRELANVFAAFRWGGLLRVHRISAMEFPYSVGGLTAAHMKMRWPDISDDAPDKPGTRFRKTFGAIPVVLGLDYPAVA
jgi:flagellum-specific peptidoglycan hydrolase FlgJ